MWIWSIVTTKISGNPRTDVWEHLE